MLLEDLRTFGAPISYCKKSKSYYYTEKGQFSFRFKKETLPEEIGREADPVATKRILARLMAYDIPVYSDIIMMML